MTGVGIWRGTWTLSRYGRAYAEGWPVTAEELAVLERGTDLYALTARPEIIDVTIEDAR
ncbi:hypothetical protein [Nocardia otitidiscaviarum]|uniref:hypothetical protein n=1 Tax=Nocardia otitidiscaviarum TaxID=1823 RepID=UPI00189568F7|nr:hypothetical protein [Nocardia otitidiscaviarum]MBF6237659.1 hypothetical protein [Nocardia otitidiscaviarum]